MSKSPVNQIENKIAEILRMYIYIYCFGDESDFLDFQNKESIVNILSHGKSEDKWKFISMFLEEFFLALYVYTAENIEKLG